MPNFQKPPSGIGGPKEQGRPQGFPVEPRPAALPQAPARRSQPDRATVGEVAKGQTPRPMPGFVFSLAEAKSGATPPGQQPEPNKAHQQPPPAPDGPADQFAGPPPSEPPAGPREVAAGEPEEPVEVK